MNKVASYLQGHISGEVLVGERVREHFSTDASILSIKPSMVVYPRTTSDVRKVARFSWQLAERGHAVPLTARGNGTDTTGAAIGKGIVLSFPTHLNKILEIDTKQKMVRVQPGVNFKSLQETLHTHGLFLPPQPASYEYSTIGGAIANNASGMNAEKYGSMAQWVDRLEVVLANGEVIQTGPVSKRELNKKLGLPTLEGEIYRAVDAILSDGDEALKTYQEAIDGAMFDNVGYALSRLKKKNGDIDLTRLFVGSQGTLGIVTEAILKVEPYTPSSALVVAAFGTIDEALEVAEVVSSFKPGSVELVDSHLYEFVRKNNAIELPEQLMIGDAPGVLLFVEGDNLQDRAAAKFAKQVVKNISRFTEAYITAEDIDEREKLWSYRHATAAFMSHENAGKVAVPLIEGVSVPTGGLSQLATEAKAMFRKHHMETGLWMHVLSGEVVAMPLADLGKLGDRQQVFKLLDEYMRLVVKLGGSVAAKSAEGRLRVPLAKVQAGSEVWSLFVQLRAAADPHGTMNPGVKTGTEPSDLVDALRRNYTLGDYADYLPRM